MNISQSEQLFERAQRVAPGGVHSPVRAFRGVGGTPRFIRSAKGVELVDVDGNRYIDFCMSWGPMILGHQDEEVSDFVRQALNRGWSYGTAEPYSLELAELITRALPWVEKIRFVNSGTEAVMSAIRLARAATGRKKILKFDGCYHGHADSMLVRAGSGLLEMTQPDSAGVPTSIANDTVVVPLNDPKAMKKAIDKHGRDLAAVIVEGVPANNGLLLQKDDFLSSLCECARSVGALVIFDEVITGFRVAFGGMVEKTGLRPDLVTYGKVIGGGFPVGAYGGRADLMNLVAPSGPMYQAGTLSANPVAMSAGLATLRKLQRERPYERLEKRMNDFAAGLRQMTSGSKIPLRVQSFGSIFWLIFGVVETDDGLVRSPGRTPAIQKEVFAKIFHSLLGQGVYLSPSGFEVSFLSVAHGDAHLAQAQNAIVDALKQVGA